MVGVYGTPQPESSFAESLLGGIGSAANSLGNLVQQHAQRQSAAKQLLEENAQIHDLFGYDLTGIHDPNIRKLAVEQGLKRMQQQAENEQLEQLLGGGSNDLRGLNDQPLNAPAEPQLRRQNAGANEVEPGAFEGSGGRAVPAPPGNQRQSRGILDLPDEQLVALKPRIPKASGAIDAELKRRQSERKLSAGDLKEARKETLPARQAYAAEAKTARAALANTERLSHLLDKGSLTNPAIERLAEALPKGVGSFLRNPESAAYKALLFQEFGQLKTMFPGAIRVAEINLLEDKLASLDKPDDQKRAILEANRATQQAALIRSKAAAKVEKENPGASAAEFEQMVEDEAAPQIDKLLNDTNDKIDIQIAKRGLPKSSTNGKMPSEALVLRALENAQGDEKAARKALKELGYGV